MKSPIFFSLGDLFLNLELYELPGVPEMMTCFEDVWRSCQSRPNPQYQRGTKIKWRPFHALLAPNTRGLASPLRKDIFDMYLYKIVCDWWCEQSLEDLSHLPCLQKFAAKFMRLKGDLGKGCANWVTNKSGKGAEWQVQRRHVNLPFEKCRDSRIGGWFSNCLSNCFNVCFLVMLSVLSNRACSMLVPKETCPLIARCSIL